MLDKKCPWCGLEEFKNQGAYNLHLPKCELAYYREEAKKNSKLPKGKKKHECEFRLLKESNEMEARAIKAGFTSVCDGCHELD